MKRYLNILRREFAGYNASALVQDLLAGVTVAAVAIPLALAFAVSSGADAAAGLITAIIAGLFIGGLSGASYQISGPTGAMTAILLSLIAHNGMQGMFVACALAGVLLILCAVFKVGRLVSFIPSPVIVGFTSGIAIVIAAGQIDNFFGVTSAGENIVEKLLSYGTLGFAPNLAAVLYGLGVIAVMIFWPKKWGQKVPASLAVIILSVIVQLIFRFDVAVVGAIPRTLLPETRLRLSQVDFTQLQRFITPAISIAALGMIESLLCGASGGRMKGEKIDTDQELLAQGIGNLVMPFFGGLPATAAIARTSVAIKSGARTRLTSVFHAVTILLSMFLLGGVMSQIPLSALAGVLMVTAWRMNEWDSIRYIFKTRFKTAIAQFLITMVATVVLDLTVAIVLGVLFSMLMFVVKSADLQVEIESVDPSRLPGEHTREEYGDTQVVYLTGALSFACAEKLEKALMNCAGHQRVILSMRGVPLIDAASAQALLEQLRSLRGAHTHIYLSGVSKPVKQTLDRAGVTKEIGEDHFYWDALDALEHCRSAV
jgi:SulP family sulfate permease